nr:MarR family transcriptional regulator [Bacilli bacterium]
MERESLESLESIALELAILVRRITAMTRQKDIELDRATYLLLHHIITHGFAGVKELAQTFGLDVSTVSRQVAVLEKKGYVKRTQDLSDRRAFSLTITTRGQTVCDAYKTDRLTKLEQHLKGWSTEEIQTFSALLQKYNQLERNIARNGSVNSSK